MRGFKLLLKKEWLEKTAPFKRGNFFKKFDAAGLFFGLAVSVLVACIVVMSLSQLVGGYAAVRLNGVRDVTSRLVEIATLINAVLLTAIFFYSCSVTIKLFSFDRDTEILLRLPLSFFDIFAEKIFFAYLKTLAFTSFFLLLINITVGITAGYVTLRFWLITLFNCLTMPMIPSATAAAVALPLKKLIDFLKSRYVLLLISFILLLSLGFYLYSVLLDGLKGLLETGNIKFLFNEQFVRTLQALTKYLFPANLFAKMLFGKGFFLNAFILLASGTALLAGAWVLSAKLFKDIYFLNKYRNPVKIRIRPAAKAQSSFASLMRKEFIQVFREPSLTFNCFAVALAMPVLAVTLSDVLSEFAYRMISVKADTEVALFVLALLTVLTNTFSSSNVSRDGEMFCIIKTLPLSPYAVIGAKLLFCFAVNALSLMISVLIMACMGRMSFGDAAFALPVMLILTAGGIMFATSKDLNNPDFSGAAGAKTNANLSIVSAAGITVAAAMGALAFAHSFGVTDFLASKAVTFAAIALVAVVYCGACALYLFINLPARFEAAGAKGR